jgi:hypothetical protein
MEESMAAWTLPMEGGCLCGRVRFRIARPPMLTAVCHCSSCQKMTAGAYSTTLAAPTDGFAVAQGETVIGGLHGERRHHQHCDYCKGWLFTTFEPEMGFINVRATMLDDPTWFRPFIETYTSEALPWALVRAPHAYEKFPPREELQPLLAEFARINA